MGFLDYLLTDPVTLAKQKSIRRWTENIEFPDPDDLEELPFTDPGFYSEDEKQESSNTNNSAIQNHRHDAALPGKIDAGICEKTYPSESIIPRSAIVPSSAFHVTTVVPNSQMTTAETYDYLSTGAYQVSYSDWQHPYASNETPEYELVPYEVGAELVDGSDGESEHDSQSDGEYSEFARGTASSHGESSGTFTAMPMVPPPPPPDFQSMSGALDPTTIPSSGVFPPGVMAAVNDDSTPSLPSPSINSRKSKDKKKAKEKAKKEKEKEKEAAREQAEANKQKKKDKKAKGKGKSNTPLVPLTSPIKSAMKVSKAKDSAEKPVEMSLAQSDMIPPPPPPPPPPPAGVTVIHNSDVLVNEDGHGDQDIPPPPPGANNAAIDGEHDPLVEEAIKSHILAPPPPPLDAADIIQHEDHVEHEVDNKEEDTPPPPPLVQDSVSQEILSPELSDGVSAVDSIIEQSDVQSGELGVVVPPPPSINTEPQTAVGTNDIEPDSKECSQPAIDEGPESDAQASSTPSDVDVTGESTTGSEVPLTDHTHETNETQALEADAVSSPPPPPPPPPDGGEPSTNTIASKPDKHIVDEDSLSQVTEGTSVAINDASGDIKAEIMSDGTVTEPSNQETKKQAPSENPEPHEELNGAVESVLSIDPDSPIAETVNDNVDQVVTGIDMPPPPPITQMHVGDFDSLKDAPPEISSRPSTPDHTTGLPDGITASPQKSVSFDPGVQEPKGGKLGKRDRKSYKAKKAKEDAKTKSKEDAKKAEPEEIPTVRKNKQGQFEIITKKVKENKVKNLVKKASSKELSGKAAGKSILKKTDNNDDKETVQSFEKQDAMIVPEEKSDLKSHDQDSVLGLEQEGAMSGTEPIPPPPPPELDDLMDQTTPQSAEPGAENPSKTIEQVSIEEAAPPPPPIETEQESVPDLQDDSIDPNEAATGDELLKNSSPDVPGAIDQDVISVGNTTSDSEHNLLTVERTDVKSESGDIAVESPAVKVSSNVAQDLEEQQEALVESVTKLGSEGDDEANKTSEEGSAIPDADRHVPKDDTVSTEPDCITNEDVKEPDISHPDSSDATEDNFQEQSESSVTPGNIDIETTASSADTATSLGHEEDSGGKEKVLEDVEAKKSSARDDDMESGLPEAEDKSEIQAQDDQILEDPEVSMSAAMAVEEMGQTHSDGMDDAEAPNIKDTTPDANPATIPEIETVIEDIELADNVDDLSSVEQQNQLNETGPVSVAEFDEHGGENSHTPGHGEQTELDGTAQASSIMSVTEKSDAESPEDPPQEQEGKGPASSLPSDLEDVNDSSIAVEDNAKVIDMTNDDISPFKDLVENTQAVTEIPVSPSEDPSPVDLLEIKQSDIVVEATPANSEEVDDHTVVKDSSQNNQEMPMDTPKLALEISEDVPSEGTVLEVPRPEECVRSPEYETNDHGEELEIVDAPNANSVTITVETQGNGIDQTDELRLQEVTTEVVVLEEVNADNAEMNDTTQEETIDMSSKAQSTSSLLPERLVDKQDVVEIESSCMLNSTAQIVKPEISDSLQTEAIMERPPSEDITLMVDGSETMQAATEESRKEGAREDQPETISETPPVVPPPSVPEAPPPPPPPPPGVEEIVDNMDNNGDGDDSQNVDTSPRLVTPVLRDSERRRKRRSRRSDLESPRINREGRERRRRSTVNDTPTKAMVEDKEKEKPSGIFGLFGNSKNRKDIQKDQDKDRERSKARISSSLGTKRSSTTDDERRKRRDEHRTRDSRERSATTSAAKAEDVDPSVSDVERENRRAKRREAAERRAYERAEAQRLELDVQDKQKQTATGSKGKERATAQAVLSEKDQRRKNREGARRAAEDEDQDGVRDRTDMMPSSPSSPRRRNERELRRRNTTREYETPKKPDMKRAATITESLKKPSLFGNLFGKTSTAGNPASNKKDIQGTLHIDDKKTRSAERRSERYREKSSDDFGDEKPSSTKNTKAVEPLIETDRDSTNHIPRARDRPSSRRHESERISRRGIDDQSRDNRAQTDRPREIRRASDSAHYSKQGDSHRSRRHHSDKHASRRDMPAKEHNVDVLREDEAETSSKSASDKHENERIKMSEVPRERTTRDRSRERDRERRRPRDREGDRKQDREGDRVRIGERDRGDKDRGARPSTSTPKPKDVGGLFSSFKRKLTST